MAPAISQCLETSWEVRLQRKRGKGPPGSTPISRVLLLLEDMQGKFVALGEGQASLERTLTARMDDLRSDLSRRIDVLELAIRQNSEDIQKNSEDIRKNSEDIRKNSEDIDLLKDAVAKNSDEIRSMRDLLERESDHETLLRLERRVEALERRTGIASS